MSTSTLVIAGDTADEFLERLFECEYCAECGGDVANHEAVALGLGDYGTNWFAYCLSAPIGDDPDMEAVMAELREQGR
jgi:hypothetical protein